MSGGKGLGVLRRVVDAERRRGNPAKEVLYDWQGLRGDPPFASLKYPLDRSAVEREFELGVGIRWISREDGRSGLLDEVSGAAVFEGTEKRGWWARRAQAAWWREWERNPRPRARLDASEEKNDG